MSRLTIEKRRDRIGPVDCRTSSSRMPQPWVRRLDLRDHEVEAHRKTVQRRLLGRTEECRVRAPKEGLEPSLMGHSSRSLGSYRLRPVLVIVLRSINQS